MSGPPDEAVEAMAVAVCDWGGEDWNDLNEFGRDDCRQEARSVFAALPAGVYRSDGKGNVTPGEDVAAVLRQILTMVSLPITQRRGVSDARLDAIRNATERALAALSATDTGDQ